MRLQHYVYKQTLLFKNNKTSLASHIKIGVEYIFDRRGTSFCSRVLVMDVVGGGLSKLVKPIRLYVFQHSIRLLLLQDITKASSFAILQIRPSRLHLVKQRCKGLLLPSYKMSATTAGVRRASSRLGTCETLAKSCATILFLMMVSCCLGSNAQVPLDHLSHFNPCPFNPQCQCSTGGKQKHFIRRSLLLSKLFGFLLDGSHKSCTQIKINVELFEPQRKSEEGTFFHFSRNSLPQVHVFLRAQEKTSSLRKNTF